MTKSLDGKTALVTGGSRGLGREMSERLAKSGAIVAVNYASNDEAAQRTVAAITASGGRAFAIKAKLGPDCTNEALISVLDAGLRRHTGQGGLDILVNNIGGGDIGTIATTTPEAFDATFQNNVRAPFFLTQALLPRLKDGGRVINISSAASRLAGTDFITYSMAKAAVDMFTRVLAKTLGPRRITVNAVLPGYNVGETNTHILEDPVMRKQIEDVTALGRFGQPTDIAEVVHFLASPAGGWLTGQIIEASGGFRM